MMSSSSSATVKVEKATSDLLLGPDWTMNIEICDSINTSQWLAKDVVKAVKKRLQHKSPRVQYLALTLLETMIKNCGDFVHLQVAERDILSDMVKIVKKKTDMQVREKILVLLDSWQEAFGGPQGKYPQYYWAYIELKRSGIRFPERSADAAPIFTPPVTHPVPRHPPIGFGMPSNSSVRLDEALASENGNLSLSDLDAIRGVAEVLSDMLQAVNPNDRAAVKDEVIVDLISQCRSNQKKIMHLASSTSDEELLAQGLALNDNLQYLIAKHDAIASGSPLPTNPSVSNSKPIIPSAPMATGAALEDEDEEDDEFSQLARRNSKNKYILSQNSASEPIDKEVSSTTSTNKTETSSSSVSSNALALPDPPSSVRIDTKEQDMIDLLSITLSTNPSPPHTPPTPVTPLTAAPAASNGGASHAPVSPESQGNHYNPQPYPATQGYVPYNSYVVPWAQQTLPQPVPQAQPLYPQYSYSSSYPPPPWSSQAGTANNGFTPGLGQNSATQVNASAEYPSAYSSRLLQQQSSFSSGGNNSLPSRPLQQQASFGTRSNDPLATIMERQPNPAPRPTVAAPANKPFIPSYRLFEDLIDLRPSDGTKTSGTSSSLSSLSGQNMINGRK